MYQSYQSFLAQCNQKEKITNNTQLDNLIYSFKFYIFNDRNFQDINLYQNENKIIFIDKYSNIKHNKNYFVVCFSNVLLIIEQLEISKILILFASNTDSTIFCLSEDIQNEIKNTFEGIKLNFYQNDLSNLDECISNFISQIQIKNKNAINIWKIIKKCFIGYLIQKNFNNSNINRLQNSELFFEREKPITAENFNLNFIQIRCLAITSSSKIDLVYSIECQKFYIVKTVINENDTHLSIRERNAYSNICHPFMPKYLGEIKDKYQSKLIIEYINGITLNNLSKLNLNENDKINIIFEILIAFQYLHSKQYKYRDLKPNNIMIDANKTAVIIDFDRMIENENDVVTMSFPHDFCAPEALQYQSFSNKCDIYSLGFIIKYILTSKNPKEKINWNQIESSFDKNKIEQLIKKCTDLNPQNRPSITRLINEFNLIILPDNKINLKTELFNIYSKNVKDIKYDQSLFQMNFVGQSYSKEECIVYPKNINKIIDNYHIFTFNNYAFSNFILGYLFFKGIIVPKDVNKALYYYQTAVNYNDSNSLLNIGLIYLKGDYVKKNVDYAFHCIRISYFYNNPNAQFFLGKLLLDPPYLPNNIVNAIHYLEKAANQNYPDALFVLGEIYFRGERIPNGVKKDVNKGIDYFKRAADLHQPNALCQLGYIYLHGEGVTLDINKSVYYYNLAAEQNMPEAIYALANIYDEKAYGLRDENMSIKYLFHAANQTIDPYTSSRAKYNLGLLLFKNCNKMNNKTLFINYLVDAANNNISKAQDLLGCIYYMGYGVNCDYKKAYHYFELGIRQNESNSQFFLGMMYFRGNYVIKNINKALYYLDLSSKQNHKYAQYYSGYIYLAGLGVPVDIKRAMYYLDQAAKQNNPEALFCLGDIYFRGERIRKGVKKDVNKGIDYFKRAADLNQPDALCQLGNIYLFGKGVTQDINKSISYYIRAADRNDPAAMNALGIYYMQNNKLKAINYFSLAANQTNDKEVRSKANYNLGLLYLKEKGKLYDINKSINYLQKASEDELLNAHVLLGYIYYEGFEIPRNVEKAILYLKNASSFNDSKAKNNLGVIYKIGDEVEKNLANALIYFNESIKMKNDLVASFNFIHTKFFENKDLFDYDEALKLLGQASVSNIPFATQLLCLIIIDKHQHLTLEIIENDFAQMKSKINSLIKNKNQKLNEFNRLIDNDIDFNYYNVSIKIIERIRLFQMENPNIYSKNYEQLKEVSLIYSVFGIIPRKMLGIYKKTNEKILPSSLAKDIDQQFRDGFGF